MRFKLTDCSGLVTFIDDVEFWDVGKSGDLQISGGKSDNNNKYFMQIAIASDRWYRFERVA